MAMKSTGGPGWEAAIAALQKKVAQGAHVNVGFLAGDEEGKHQLPTATIAAFNEFGTTTSPPRPFMRNAIAENKDGWPKLMAAALIATDYDVDKALGMVGKKIKDQIVKEIESFAEPANSPLTSLLKDRFPVPDRMTVADVWKAMKDVREGVTAPPGKPLIWSGQMRDSVAFEVKDGADED